MNVSHAAAVILYELTKMNLTDNERLVKKEKLRVLYKESDRFVEALDVRREHIFKLLMRRIFGRGLTSREASGVIGLLKKASWIIGGGE